MLVHGRTVVTATPQSVFTAPHTADADLYLSFHSGMWVHLGGTATITTEEPNENGFHFVNTGQFISFKLRKDDTLYAVVSPFIAKITPTVLCWLVSY